MKMRLGLDILHIPRFEKTFKENQKYFFEKVFTQGEQENTSEEKLAGIFATKEAVVKALGLKAGDWLEIEVGHQRDGRPFLKRFPFQENWLAEISLSHDGEYIVSVAIFYQP